MKKQTRRMLAVALTASVFATMLMPTSAMAASRKKPKLNKTNVILQLQKGKKVGYTLKVKNVSKKQMKKAKWKSSRKAVATVSKQGRVTAKHAGVSMISVRVAGKTLRCRVTVQPAYAAPQNNSVIYTENPVVTEQNHVETTANTTPVVTNRTKLKVSRSLLNMKVETTEQLAVTGATEPVEWSSSNTDIATVDQNGLVSAIYPGDAVLTVRSGEQEKTVTVRVSTGSMSIDGDAVQYVAEGGTLQLNMRNPVKNVSWSSADPSIAEVSDTGLVTGISAGRVTITLSAYGHTNSKVVRVQERLSIPDVTVKMGSNELLTYDSADSLEFTSSNPEVATVKHRLVTGISPGTATIIAVDKRTGQSTSFKVKVTGTKEYNSDSVVEKINARGGELVTESGGSVFKIKTDALGSNLIFTETGENTSVTFTHSAGGVMESISVRTGTGAMYAHGVANVFPKTYKRTDKLAFISQSDSKAISSLMNELCNTRTKLAFEGWSKLLTEQTGYTFSDLGFEQYVSHFYG